jgi:hypothetical protein
VPLVWFTRGEDFVICSRSENAYRREPATRNVGTL